ncbi:polysaccharide deacetylase family protein [Paenibacillus puerhi]|uniref:polysaccharide deacetylase family protein n=1 Tax=Paenibacillus puerhi TaxID=2692622 RepID=UPI0013584E3D|nr:polysaccharide deacetylase family protein [Paenibacillus puerhi]
MLSDTYEVCIIELLSLKQDSTCCKLELALNREEGTVRCEIEIDEYTYDQLVSLELNDSARVRLSPYSKWDPFKKTHFSSLVATKGSTGKTFYFACSVLYQEQLQRIKGRSYTPKAPRAVDQEKELIGQTLVGGKSPLGWLTTRKRHGLGVLGLILALMFVTVLATGKDEPALTAVPDNRLEQWGLGHVPPMEAELASMEAGMKPFTAETGSREVVELKPPPPERMPSEQTAGVSEWYEIGEADALSSLPEGYVALTFDDGPSVYTRKIVDILVEHKVAATFFFIGENARKRPEMVTYASEREMAVGSHSWNHRDLSQASSAEQKADLTQTNEVLEPLVQSPITLFRPPYGSLNNALMENMKANRMKMVLWNRDPTDWTEGKKAEDLVRYMQEHTPSKGIYVFHEKAATVEALPEMIEYLKQQQLKFVLFK